MLELLSSKKQWKVAELAQILEVESRAIVRYKKILVEAGWPIKSRKGKNGG